MGQRGVAFGRHNNISLHLRSCRSSLIPIAFDLDVFWLHLPIKNDACQGTAIGFQRLALWNALKALSNIVYAPLTAQIFLQRAGEEEGCCTPLFEDFLVFVTHKHGVSHAHARPAVGEGQSSHKEQRHRSLTKNHDSG